MSVRALPVPRPSHAQSTRGGMPRWISGRRLQQRLEDDQDLIEVKLVVLAGLALLAMAIEFYL